MPCVYPPPPLLLEGSTWTPTTAPPCEGSGPPPHAVQARPSERRRAMGGWRITCTSRQKASDVRRPKKSDTYDAGPLPLSVLPGCRLLFPPLSLLLLLLFCAGFSLAIGVTTSDAYGPMAQG